MIIIKKYTKLRDITRLVSELAQRHLSPSVEDELVRTDVTSGGLKTSHSATSTTSTQMQSNATVAWLSPLTQDGCPDKLALLCTLLILIAFTMREEKTTAYAIPRPTRRQAQVTRDGDAMNAKFKLNIRKMPNRINELMDKFDILTTWWCRFAINSTNSAKVKAIPTKVSTIIVNPQTMLWAENNTSRDSFAVDPEQRHVSRRIELIGFISEPLDEYRRISRVFIDNVPLKHSPTWKCKGKPCITTSARLNTNPQR